ncbi:DNA-3-methyladenine glycosylase family protein [Undibacterium macrobrachii]|jgi:DNA-3-methyladenine glycosylase II|uniref:DNA-3-methyladenine glycosylase II n=1 Tax=Undibacterium macrobrachii TaxID=1119058 RepID=A0ABQ2X649_9BURK|nr:DNA-3-methyladenine glycosylase 2 family protein [Undibacterium macrobrachii]GGX01148.1 DNA-3-methyladenine glycosylase [Undibacterium macrobrachii]
MNKNSRVRSNGDLHVPHYWEEAKNELMKRDRILRKLIPQFGDLYLLGRDDPFTTLTRSIIAQQISGVSANLLWEKYLTVCPKSTPVEVLAAGKEKLLASGLSKRKTDYILDLAVHFKDGKVHVDNWVDMTDEAVIAELVQIRGISRWTAEMFLIFNLLRPNILPLDDAGLINGISKNYFSGEPVSRIDLREVAANWEPWRTVATWYMWRSLDEKIA